MKKFFLLPIFLSALALSCEKPMSEADRNAQVEIEVQRRLTDERQKEVQERLAQAQADLDAREKALEARETVTTTESTAVATPRATARTTTSRSETTRSASSSSSKVTARSYDTFYRKLDPYGAWRETNDYGYVWQPRAAQQSRDWRPYTNGRWAYTDAGWTWVSEEPFGWATYHYGRWTRLRGVGWVWVPGDEWAPAWVSWRSSEQHLGWAPLPPEARFERRTGIKKWADSYYDIGADEYVFIPNEDIGAENLERSVLPVERNVTIVNQTTNVTNITYSNTRIMNEGPNYDQLRGRSRRPVERMRLEREYDLGDEEPRATVRGNVLALMAPIFAARASERPRNVGQPIRQTTVERSWATAGNQQEAERAREKMRSEATPPPDAPKKGFERPIVGDASPAPVATSSPRAETTPAPTASAAPSVAASVTPEPIASATPRRGPRTTPTPTAEASVSEPTAAPTARVLTTPEPTATPVAATPAPTAISTPTPMPTAVSTPTPRPTAISTPTPMPTAVSTPTPRPTAISTPTPRPTAISTPTPEPKAEPVETPRSRVTDPPIQNDPQAGARDPQEKEEARSPRGGRGREPRREREATREEEPQATAPPKSVPEPEPVTQPQEATPNLKGANRARTREESPQSPRTPETAEPTAAPVEKPKAIEKDADAEEKPQATPSGANEP